MKDFDFTTLTIGSTLVSIVIVIAAAFLYTGAQNRALYQECLKTYERVAAQANDRYIGSNFCSRY